MSAPIRVMLAGAQALATAATEARLAALGFELVGIAGDALGVLELFHGAEPEIVLMDIRLADDELSMPIAAVMTARRPSVAIVFVASSDDLCMLDVESGVVPCALLIKPLREQEMRSVLQIARRRSEDLRIAEARDFELVEARRRVSVALSELSRLRREDALTGVGNRHALDEALERECGRVRRIGGSLALIMIELDWFARYNECHGRSAGDDCLRLIAAVLSPFAARSTDTIARCAGNVFALLLPDTGTRGALSQMERSADELRQLAVPHEGSPLGFVTASIGAAVTSARACPPPARLFWEADEALARAKRRGRDRTALVVVSDGGQARPGPAG